MLRNLVFRFAKQKPLDAFKSFLEHDAGSSIRQEVHHKDRKYAHVEIAREFKRQEESRKKLRLEQVTARKKLLQQKLTTESKLLTSQEDQELKNLSNEITTLQQLLEKQSKDLATIDKQLEQTEAEMVLLEGPRKLVVLNNIEYLKHMNMHPSGLVLHPETIKIIENVHYLVNNNLPVNKYKLFEIMPDLFATEIGELDESMRKLIEEKKLDPLSDPSGRIRFFAKHHARFQDPEHEIIALQRQRDLAFQNLQQEAVKMLEPHMGYIRKVDLGETPFRNSDHLIAVMLSDSINLNLTQEQAGVRDVIREIVNLREKFDIYSDEVNRQVIKMRYKYIEPPQYVKNHPVLLQRYEKLMVKYTNPEQVTSTLQIETSDDDGGRAYLQQHLRKVVIQKYHPIIEQLWNSGQKDKLVAMKKQLQIDFYNDSTRILEEYNEMLLQEKDKEEFLKLPKKAREIPQQSHGMLTLDELTKTIMKNNSNPVKYNLGFFTKYFGLESQEQTRKLFNSFSYLRVPVQEQKSIEKLTVEIIKFKGE